MNQEQPFAGINKIHDRGAILWIFERRVVAEIKHVQVLNRLRNVVGIGGCLDAAKGRQRLRILFQEPAVKIVRTARANDQGADVVFGQLARRGSRQGRSICRSLGQRLAGTSAPGTCGPGRSAGPAASANFSRWGQLSRDSYQRWSDLIVEAFERNAVDWVTPRDFLAEDADLTALCQLGNAL